MTPANDAARWAQIKALFDTALDRPPAEREALVAAAGLDAADLAELRSLLAHHEHASAAQVFMAENAAQALAEPVPEAACAGQRLGAWEIVLGIGSGGMGEVYEARRADGSYEGRAAVKLLKRGMDSAAVLQRFAQERQALARLSHPHIARLLDAGASDDGLPYFVLEYVDGQRIDAAARALPLEQRLALFLQLADAVAHAHRNLLVHRDLKPGNVLVTGEGQVKLLDFGIAKALDPVEGRDGPGGDTTAAGQRPYTPHHASPEQIRGEAVSTATDIYSLGVLLYQMLTGVRPTGRHAATPAEAARSVLDEEPTRPSRLSPADTADPQWPRLRQRLEGDLDNILLKALEKAPERRYASVDAMAADVRRYIDGFPVSARAASPGYRLRKLVARHRGATAGAVLAVLALVGGTLVSAWQAQEARQAQQLAEFRLQEVRRITHELVFGFGDSVEYLPGGMKIKAELFRDTLAALQRLVPTLGDDEAALADLVQVHVRLAEAYSPSFPASLNQPADAQAHAQQAVALIERIWAGQRGDTAFATYAIRAFGVLAAAERGAGRLEPAVALSRRALQLAEEAADAAAPGPGRLLMMGAVTAGRLNLGQLLDDNGVGLGRHEEALAMYRGAREMALRQQAMPAEAAALDAGQRPEHTRFAAELGQALGVIQGSMASSLLRRGDHAGAAAARREAVAALRQAQQVHPEQRQFWESLATSLNLQAGLELQMGQPTQALAAAAESRQWTERLLARDPGNAEFLDDLELGTLTHGTALALAGEPAQALPLLARAVRYWQGQLALKASPRAERLLLLAQLRLARAQAAASSSAGAPASATARQLADAAQRLEGLSQRDAGSADTWLAYAEAAQALAVQGETAGRAGWLARACRAWEQAATLRPLAPAAQAQKNSLAC